MSKAPKAVGASAGNTVRDGADLLRLAIVITCATALILAGQALPF